VLCPFILCYSRGAQPATLLGLLETRATLLDPLSVRQQFRLISGPESWRSEDGRPVPRALPAESL
jgi:hypothetical protein